MVTRGLVWPQKHLGKKEVDHFCEQLEECKNWDSEITNGHVMAFWPSLYRQSGVVVFDHGCEARIYFWDIFSSSTGPDLL